MYLLFIRCIWVLLKFLLHPSELSCMHPALETSIPEDQPKKKTKTQIKPPPKQRDQDSHLFPGALWLSGRGRLRSGRFLQEGLQCQSLQSPSYTRRWDARWSVIPKVASLGFFPVCLICLPSSHTVFIPAPPVAPFISDPQNMPWQLGKGVLQP